tara:strand:- start:643 stop:876 length:234 start_codon:yes stop_codon:yes gene_type:complete
MKTRFDKALENAYSEESSHENINKSIQLAKNLKILDVIDPSSKIIGELAEMVSRLKNAEKLEIVDISDFTTSINSYS